MIQLCKGPTDKDLVKAYGLGYSVLNSLKAPIIKLLIDHKVLFGSSLCISVLRATLCKFFILLLHRGEQMCDIYRDHRDNSAIYKFFRLIQKESGI
jgi:hypothetical protein